MNVKKIFFGFFLLFAIPMVSAEDVNMTVEVVETTGPQYIDRSVSLPTGLIIGTQGGFQFVVGILDFLVRDLPEIILLIAVIGLLGYILDKFFLSGSIGKTIKFVRSLKDEKI